MGSALFALGDLSAARRASGEEIREIERGNRAEIRRNPLKPLQYGKCRYDPAFS